MKKQIFTLTMLFCSLLDLQAKDSTTFTVGASVNYYRKENQYRSFNLSVGIKKGRSSFELGPAYVTRPQLSPDGQLGFFCTYSRKLNRKSAIFEPYLTINLLGYSETRGAMFDANYLQSFVGYGIRLNITKEHSVSSDFNIGKGWLNGDGQSFPLILKYNLKYSFCF